MIVAALLTVFSTGILQAGDESLWTTTVTPDALIIQDLTGSMAWLPNGSSPTFYSCGSSCTEPYYTTVQTSSVPSTLYVVASSCSSDGPYTISDPDLVGMPTSTLYYLYGNTCGTSYAGPYYTTKPSPSFNLTTVYANSSCTGASYAYYAASGTGHTKPCTVSSSALSGNPVYSSTSDCSTGPFYKNSASGRTACYKYSSCTLSSGYTASSCTTGTTFYTSYDSTHPVACGTSTSCTTPSTVYASDCATGPYYKTSSSSHSLSCGACSKACSVSGTTYKYSSTSSCAGPFYSSSTGRTDCSKIAIAKRSLFQLLDYDSDSSITSADVTGLGMRLGLMRYYNCSAEDNYTGTSPSTDLPFYAGCEKVIWPITESDTTTTPTPYANIYCNSTTCASTVTACTVTSPTKECIAGFSVTGGTPLADSIKEAKYYLDYHKSLDASATCRPKSIIVITDGADTYSCSGNGSSTNAAQRRSPIYYAKKAADAGYKVYVVGFGAAMSDDEKNTLNWAAYYGGTRNPNDSQSGDTTAVTVGTSDPCNNGTDPSGHTLSGYAFMASNPDELVSALASAITSIQEATYSFSAQASVAAARVETENYIYEASFEPKNDTGSLKEPFWTGHLKKYNIGSDGALITPYCWDAGALLRDTAASSRSMWTSKGSTSLTEFSTSNMTDADFGGTGSTCSATLCLPVVGFFRGDSTYNLESWKLGDLFHTNPAAVKTPAQYFYDPRQCSATAFSAFRSSNTRTASSGLQLMLVGANDGQLHAFQTGSGSDCTGGGEEIWSFIPPNLLQKMAPIAHNSHADRASLSSHTFFIDGPIQVADAWLPSTNSSGTSKSASEWKTIAIFGEGQGSGNYLWSSSSSCYSASTSGFSATYDATNYPYYCGYYALDVTNTSAATPTLLGRLMPSSSQAPYLGEPWSKAQIGRIKYSGYEKWVAFIGGGYNASTCLSDDGTTSTACNTPATGSAGKGFFIIDLSNSGTILWSYTHADNSYMDFSAPASPLPLDLDSDGFIDTVYMGDLGGNMWRFRLCAKDETTACNVCGKSDYATSPCTSCSTSTWTGSRLFASTNTERGYGLSTPSNSHKQIFTTAAAAKDSSGNILIFFGTGQNNDPTWRPTTAIPDTSDTKNRLYMIKEDPNFTATRYSSSLTNITSSVFDYTSSLSTTTCSSGCDGWYINLATNSVTRSDGTVITDPTGEKMISDPTIFGGVVYFPTYVPDQGTTNACGLSGDAMIYELNYLTGAGAVTTTTTTSGTTTTTTTRTTALGHGIGSSILVSYRPGYSAADIYATASGGAGTAALTQEVGQAPKTSSMTNILYWKDRRLQ